MASCTRKVTTLLTWNVTEMKNCSAFCWMNQLHRALDTKFGLHQIHVCWDIVRISVKTRRTFGQTPSYLGMGCTLFLTVGDLDVLVQFVHKFFVLLQVCTILCAILCAQQGFNATAVCQILKRADHAVQHFETETDLQRSVERHLRNMFSFSKHWENLNLIGRRTGKKKKVPNTGASRGMTLGGIGGSENMFEAYTSTRFYDGAGQTLF